MYLYMFIDYVVLCNCDYGYALVHVYLMYMLMPMLMLHHDMHFILYPMSRHRLASTLA